MSEHGDSLKYSYVSKPRAVQSSHAKGVVRESAERPPGKPNIMHDPRVARGSVFAAHTFLSPSNENNEKTKKRKSHASSRLKPNLYQTPKVSTYSFTPLSLEANLIEQVSSTTEREVSSQTDEFTRYVTTKKNIAVADGLFQRPKVGVDSGTQMDEADKLFDFDLEVKPLLNVLVSKTLAQALTEVQEEQQLNAIIRERAILTSNKAAAERMDRELENKAKEVFHIKEQKRADQEIRRQRLAHMREKVLAWQIAHQLVPDIIQRTNVTLQQQGVFFDPIQRELARWLSKDVYNDANAKNALRGVARSLLDDLLSHGLYRQHLFAILLPHEDEAFVRITLKDPIIIQTNSNSPVENLMSSDSPLNVSRVQEHEQEAAVLTELRVIGPILLSRKDSFATIEKKLQAWVTENFGVSVSLPVQGLLSILSLNESKL